jgi:hypothetical protein
LRSGQQLPWEIKSRSSIITFRSGRIINFFSFRSSGVAIFGELCNILLKYRDDNINHDNNIPREFVTKKG